MKRVVHLGSRNYGRLTAAGPDAAVVPDLRRPALRHHVAVPRARRAPGRRSRRCCTRACTTSTSATTAGLRWYRGHFPLQRRAERVAASSASRRRPSSPARTTCTTRRPPARIAADLPGVKLIVLRPRPGRAGLLRSTRTRSPAASRPEPTSAARWPWSRRGWPGRRSGCSPTRTTTASRHQHHAYRARGEYVELARAAGRSCVGRDRMHVVDSERVLRRARSRSTTRSSTSSGCRTLGPYPAVRAAQRPAPQPARRLDRRRSSPSTTRRTTSGWPAGSAAARPGCPQRTVRA